MLIDAIAGIVHGVSAAPGLVKLLGILLLVGVVAGFAMFACRLIKHKRMKKTLVEILELVLGGVALAVGFLLALLSGMIG